MLGLARTNRPKPTDAPRGCLLDILREAGAQDQVTALADRAAPASPSIIWAARTAVKAR
jgi:hypothetical protein